MALTEAQAAQLVDQLEDDAAILHEIVHGGDDSETETEGGTVPSIAKVVADAETKLDMMLDEAEGDLGAAVAKAEAWADEDEDVEVEAGKFSAKHWTAKAAAIRDSLVNVVELMGEFDASTGSFPADPDIGDYWIVTTGGTVSATVLVAGDEIIYGPSGWIIVGRNLSANEILTLLLTVDGAGSGLDADKLDGFEAAYFAPAAALNDKLTDPDENGLIVRTAADGATEAVAWSDWAGWTPSIMAATPGDLGVTYHSRSGRWARVGDTVIAQFLIEFTPTFSTASGQFRVTGWPVTPASEASGPLSYFSGVGNAPPSYPAGRTALIFSVSAAAIGVFRSYGSGLGANAIVIGDFVSGNRYLVAAQATYEAAS